MNDQIENDKLTSDAAMQQMALNTAASTYAYNKINNLLLMQVLAHVESRDLEEIRNNVENYIIQFSEEFKKANGLV
jgi:hypothetical protein